MKHNVRSEIFAVLASVDPRDCRQSPDAEVWILEEPGLLSSDEATRSEALHQCKRRQLTAVAGSGFLVHSDDPASAGIESPWPTVGPHTYRMPAQLDLDNSGLDYWIFTLGNWLAYVASTPVNKGWPDPFKTAPPELIAWMASAGVQVLIASFPDDTDWVVAVTEQLAA